MAWLLPFWSISYYIKKISWDNNIISHISFIIICFYENKPIQDVEPSDDDDDERKKKKEIEKRERKKEAELNKN